jgi:hypothetical protein
VGRRSVFAVNASEANIASPLYVIMEICDFFTNQDNTTDIKYLFGTLYNQLASVMPTVAGDPICMPSNELFQSYYADAALTRQTLCPAQYD